MDFSRYIVAEGYSGLSDVPHLRSRDLLYQSERGSVTTPQPATCTPYNQYCIDLSLKYNSGRVYNQAQPTGDFILAKDTEDKLRSIRLSVWILIVLFLLGTTVFYLIGSGEHTLFDAAWMTLHILTTVGDTGFERTVPEKAWSIVLMLVGVMAVFYLGINVVAFILDGELRKILGRRHLMSKIKKMNDHFIVCGFGRMGRALCEAMEEKGASFVLIDNDPEATTAADDAGYLYIRGDAMQESSLLAARIETAQGLASCLPDDADNVFVTLTARDLNRELTIVSKADYDQGAERLRRAGANHTLSPSGLAASRAMTKLMLPAVDELIEIVVHGPDLEISKVSLDRLPGATNQPLRHLELPAKTSLLVVAIVHADGTRSFNPSPDTRLSSGDELIVIGPRGGVTTMIELFKQE
jgi:voltage-gated potassium channel